jgi:hypothetical protein
MCRRHSYPVFGSQWCRSETCILNQHWLCGALTAIFVSQERSTRFITFPKTNIEKLEQKRDTGFILALDIRPVTASNGVGGIAATGFVNDYDKRTRTLVFVGQMTEGFELHWNMSFRIMLLPCEVMI